MVYADLIAAIGFGDENLAILHCHDIIAILCVDADAVVRVQGEEGFAFAVYGNFHAFAFFCACGIEKIDARRRNKALK